MLECSWLLKNIALTGGRGGGVPDSGTIPNDPVDAPRGRMGGRSGRDRIDPSESTDARGAIPGTGIRGRDGGAAAEIEDLLAFLSSFFLTFSDLGFFFFSDLSFGILPIRTDPNVSRPSRCTLRQLLEATPKLLIAVLGLLDMDVDKMN
jgi:hypothetical protein